MALMREAELWAAGEASSGGYSGVGEVSSRGGAEGSRSEELGIWNTDEEENSGNDSTLSLLAPGLDRSCSECCWFQLQPVGPETLRPTPGYALI
jgi:hypothetical protein